MRALTPTLHDASPMPTKQTSATTTISPDWSVNETLHRFPETIAVFNAFRVDACCGGAATLRQAALDAAVPLEDLLHALVTSTQAGAEGAR